MVRIQKGGVAGFDDVSEVRDFVGEERGKERRQRWR